MVDTIAKEELERLRRAFSVFDKNGDGEIDTVELTNVLRMLGKNPSPAEVAEIMKRVDKDRSGTINFPEFLAMMLQKKKCSQLDADLRTSFQYYDKNKDGYICSEELRSVLRKHPGPLSQVDINMLIQEVDRDGDGRLNYEAILPHSGLRQLIYFLSMPKNQRDGKFEYGNFPKFIAHPAKLELAFPSKQKVMKNPLGTVRE